MHVTRLPTSVLCGLLLLGCKEKQPPETVADPVVAAADSEVAQPNGAQEPDEDGMGEGDEDWVPNEHAEGAKKWKDPYIYIDGEAVGILAFAELPATLEPMWVDEDDPMPGGEKPPKVRRYAFRDLVKAFGVNPAKVKEIHVYGPRQSESVVVSGKQMAKTPGFQVRFGGLVFGKPIPVIPPSLGDVRSPDKISAVAVYVDKKPPRLVKNEGFYLGDELIDGIPYHGDPIRGGVRVYKDDRLVSVIKRRDLTDRSLATKDAEGKVHWKLLPFLESQGVKTDDIVAGQWIYDELRQGELDAGTIKSATFEADAQAKGEVEVEGKPAQAIALYTKPITDKMRANIKLTEDEETYR